MRRLCSLLIVLSGCVMGQVAPAPPAAVVKPPEVRTVLLPVEGSNIVSVRIVFHSGSASDPDGRHGLTALSAALVAEGGTKGMPYSDLLVALYPLATDLTVHVDKEHTVFSATVLADHAAYLLRLLGQILVHPRLDAGDLARLRARQIAEIDGALKVSDDEALGRAVLEQMLFGPGHPYAHLTAGSKGNLEAVGVSDIRDHLPRIFSKRRMIVGLAGAVGPRLESLAREVFAGLPEGVPAEAIPEPSAPARAEILIVEKRSAAAAIFMGFVHDRRRGRPGFLELQVAAFLFAGGPPIQGRPNRRRGASSALRPYVSAEYFGPVDGDGLLRLNVPRSLQHFEIGMGSVALGSRLGAMRWVHDRRVRWAEGLSAPQVARASRTLRAASRGLGRTADRALGDLLDDRFYGGPDGRRGSVQTEVRLEDVERVISRHLAAQPFKIVLVTSDAASLRNQLLAGASGSPVSSSTVSVGVGAPLRADLGLDAADIRIVPVERLFR